jgi:hypothetical protein
MNAERLSARVHILFNIREFIQGRNLSDVVIVENPSGIVLLSTNIRDYTLA